MVIRLLHPTPCSPHDGAVNCARRDAKPGRQLYACYASRSLRSYFSDVFVSEFGKFVLYAVAALQTAIAALFHFVRRIVFPRSSEQMGRIAARGVIAVVTGKVFPQRAVRDFIRDAMGIFGARKVSKFKQPVSRWECVANPRPASIWGANENARPKGAPKRAIRLAPALSWDGHPAMAARLRFLFHGASSRNPAWASTLNINIPQWGAGGYGN